MDLSSLEVLKSTLTNKRYETDFINKEKIGRGGFASVYRAENRLDGHAYAIKKIKLSVKDLKNNFNKELQRILSEAKVLASVNHPHILRYYNSWLEGATKKRKPSLRINAALARLRPTNECSQDSPFVLKGLEDCEEGSPCVVFESSSHEQHKPAHVENKKKSLFAKANPIFDNEAISEDPLDLGQSSEDAFKKFSKKTEESGIPMIGDEILDSISFYIQTELCSQTLEDYINKRNQRLNKLKHNHPENYIKEKKNYLKDAIAFAKQIINGLSYIHNQKIVHRDLKPGNIFLVGKTIKIGDFGLVKKLQSFRPLEASPFASSVSGKDSTDYSRPESLIMDQDSDGFTDLTFQKANSDPVLSNHQSELDSEVDSPMTKSVGTRTFASPEQLKADKGNFDQRSDIFSLGLVYLLLFYPMKTTMEQHNVIKDCKNGKVPSELEKEVPEIAKLIIKMLSSNPNDRPSLDEITRCLNVPLSNCSDLSGVVSVQKENTTTWRRKHFKLIANKLYLFEHEEDKKAEQVFELNDWRVLLQSEGDSSLESDSRNSASYIVFENPMQLGCTFKAESYAKTVEIFEKVQSIGEAA